MVAQENRLHLGCGPNTPEGWINLDGSWNAWLGKHPRLRRLLKALHVVPATLPDISWSPNILIHDVRRRLPFHDNFLSAIYASHLLEHLYLEEAKTLLKECFRVLKPAGVLRMVVPDLRAVVLEYMGENAFGNSSNSDTMCPGDRLNKRLHLRSPEPPSGNAIYRLYRALKDFHSHKWMYDADSLMYHFKWAGFVDVEEMQFLQSRIEGIEEIEKAERVLSGAGVCVEGIKPAGMV